MGAQCYNFNIAFQGADSIYPRLVGRQIPGTLMEAALKPLCIWCWITVYPGFPLLGHLVIGSVLMRQIKNNKKKKTVHSRILAVSNTLGLRPGSHFEVTCLRVCALAGSLLCIHQLPSCCFLSSNGQRTDSSIF